jgi:threonylcarbamoyladenosine tRNA methylthiotransferase CDKAL1
MRIFVKSFGCSTNLADGEVLAGCLAKAGHRLVRSPSAADVLICNTCAVKGPTEDRMIYLLKRVPTNKRLIVAGCLPLINFERLRREVRFDGVVGPAAGDRIVDVARRVSNDEKVVALEDATKSMPSLNLPRSQLSPVISIIPVSYGCLGQCAYCCVTYARGHLRSYSVEEIVDRVRQDVALGVRELWITSQDAACYGKDKGSNLAELLNALCRIEGDFKVRVGMMTPNALMDFLDECVEAFHDEHVFKFVHLPVQSGDDEILKRMRRFYSVDEFKSAVATFRASFPMMTLSTDIICGFPGESEEAFESTMQLIEEVKPDIVNVSKFFARPRTVATKMEEEFVPLREIRRRSSGMAALARKVAFEHNKRWVGWAGEILADETGKVSGSWVGRNFAYKPIAVKSSCKELGKTMKVKVIRAFSTYLEGEVIE